MSYSQEGEKKPGKLWHAYQRTKAIFTERKKLGAYYVDAGVKSVSAGVMFSPIASLIGTVANVSVFGVLSLPFTLVGAAVGAGALYMTRNWIKGGISELFHNRYTDAKVQDATEKWIEKKNRPGLFKRMGASIKNALTFGKKNTAEAEVGAPKNNNSAPKLEAANQNYESGQQSPAFQEAAAKANTQAPAVDPKAEARREARRQARNNKKNNLG